MGFSQAPHDIKTEIRLQQPLSVGFLRKSLSTNSALTSFNHPPKKHPNTKYFIIYCLKQGNGQVHRPFLKRNMLSKPPERPFCKTGGIFFFPLTSLNIFSLSFFHPTNVRCFLNKTVPLGGAAEAAGSARADPEGSGGHQGALGFVGSFLVLRGLYTIYI